MPRILISDKYAPEGVKMLEGREGFDVDVRTGMSPEELKACIGDYDALLVRSATKPNADILSHAKDLKLIVRGGEGVDNIDCSFAAEKGIIVENTPGQNSHAVAELTIGLLFALARHITRADATTKAGNWEKKALMGTELRGKTLGLIGVGKIGKDVGSMAEALGMKVIYTDIIDAGAFEKVEMDELLSRSDYISIHVPLLDSTRNLIDAGKISRMKKTAYLVNCARGGIVDETALAEAVKSGVIAGAATDVYTKEPPGEDNPLVSCEGIICIPHLGASSKEAQVNCAVAAAEQVIAFFERGEVINRVN